MEDKIFFSHWSWYVDFGNRCASAIFLQSNRVRRYDLARKFLPCEESHTELKKVDHRPRRSIELVDKVVEYYENEMSQSEIQYRKQLITEASGAG
jgi:hypothetical protein